jgi:succinate dehydrogenase/fumarate reductase flavoprotein subunit
VKGALAGGALFTAATLTACASDKKEVAGGTAGTQDWDRSVDVVVVGCGFAGLATALTVNGQGVSVLVVEKAPEAEVGGNSRVCAQAIWTPQNIDAAISYFKELMQPEHIVGISDAMIEKFVKYASETPAWLTDIADVPLKQAANAEYPLAPSAEAAKEGSMSIHDEGLGNSRIWLALREAAVNAGIEFAYESPMSDLVYNQGGEVIGIKASTPNGEISIAAKKGVVLCCGGFEFDPVMKADYLQFPALAWGSPYNTGDVHKVCMKYDIDFWHMASATPATRIGVPMSKIDPKHENKSLDFELSGGTGYIWTDKYGARFMNEARSYQHGYGRNAIFYNDSMKMEWPRLPFWQIFDSEEVPRLGTPTTGWLTLVDKVTISEGLADEIAAGLVVKADTLPELAEKMGVDAAVLEATVNRFNEAAASGTDSAFGRPEKSMRPIAAPYYAAQVYPVMVNTNGGPRRNEDACVIRTDGTPVPRLYSAGEFGSIWAWYYQGAGNTGECIAFGRIAGENVSKLEPWS